MKKLLAFFSILVFTFCLTVDSHADRRSYVWTYEYQTMPKGLSEIEYYLTEEQKDVSKAKPNTWKHWLELEYGITDHLDIAMYQQLKQSNLDSGDTFEYDGFKVRTRYRILERDKLPVDILLYMEYIRNDNLKKANVLEGKAIFAKDIGDLNISYNQIIEQELDSGGETEHEYAAGVSYMALPNFRIGVESKGSFSDRKYYIGPTIAWSSHKFWVSIGAIAGLNDRSDDLDTRLLVGIPF